MYNIFRLFFSSKDYSLHLVTTKKEIKIHSFIILIKIHENIIL